FKLVEGSGISRKNRLTPEAIWQLLKAFAPYQYLLHEDNGVLLKTGTLRGVYTMAGYLPGTQPLYFVILLNQSQNYRNKILQILLSTDFSAGKF
ncbi:MAG: penicillin-binding protein 4, partial [Deltaproteobacteria bacterium]|nr:penicillin-binding protein 4 [Deltaproteobacteria bacterium]